MGDRFVFFYNLKGAITISKYLKIIFPSFALSVLSGLSLIILILVSELVLKQNEMLSALTLPTLLSLVVLPVVLKKFLGIQGEDVVTFNKLKIFILLLLTIILVIIYFIKFQKNISEQTMIILIVHYYLAAFSEEFLYRKIIIDDISSKWNDIAGLIISAILFAFIGHLGEGFINNFIYRLPLGLILGVIKIKTKTIAYTTIIHAFYNLFLVS